MTYVAIRSPTIALPGIVARLGDRTRFGCCGTATIHIAQIRMCIPHLDGVTLMPMTGTAGRLHASTSLSA